jgi:uncharacterized membrane protein
MFSKFMYFVGVAGVAALLNACDRGPTADETVYRCGKLSVRASFQSPDHVVLGLLGESVPMVRDRSDAARTYEGVMNNGGGVVFTMDGDAATLSIDADANNSFNVCECRAIVPDAAKDFVSFKAVGHDPEWYFTFNTMIFGFSMPGVEKSIVVPAENFHIPQMARDKIKMRLSQGAESLDVHILKKTCEDRAAGQFFAYTVQITYAGADYTGCGLSLSDPKQSLLPL